VRMHVGPKTFGHAGALLSWDGAWLTLRNTLLPMCYRNWSLGQTVWGEVGVPKILGCWGPPLWDGV